MACREAAPSRKRLGAGAVRGWRMVTRTARGALDELFPDLIEQALREHGEWSADEAESYCARCGASAGPGAVMRAGCAFCAGGKLAWDRLTRLGLYDEPLDGWIKAMKYARQWRWAHWFGDRLADVLDGPFDGSGLVVCPVPMHWTRRWGRGFNQAHLMGERVAQRRGWTFWPMLRRTRATRPQSSLEPTLRVLNVRNAVALAGEVDLTGREVLLVDDVKTTGATLSVCARRLRDAGARSVQVAVAAVADPRGDRFRSR